MSAIESVSVALDATGADLEDVSVTTRQIPAASALAARTRVTVLAKGLRRRTLLGRHVGDTRVTISRVARCTALLVLGYVSLGANDHESWGEVPGP